MSEFAGLYSKLRKAAEAVKGEITALDTKISALNSERQSLLDAPVSKEDFMEYVRADIAARAQGYQGALKRWRRKNEFNSFAQLERRLKQGGACAFPYLNGEHPIDGTLMDAPAMYWLFGEQIAVRFADAIDCFDWPAETVSIADRRKRVGEIDEELDTLVDKRDALAADLIKAGIPD